MNQFVDEYFFPDYLRPPTVDCEPASTTGPIKNEDEQLHYGFGAALESATATDPYCGYYVDTAAGYCGYGSYQLQDPSVTTCNGGWSPPGLLQGYHDPSTADGPQPYAAAGGWTSPDGGHFSLPQLHQAPLPPPPPLPLPAIPHPEVVPSELQQTGFCDEDHRPVGPYNAFQPGRADDTNQIPTRPVAEQLFSKHVFIILHTNFHNDAYTLHAFFLRFIFEF